MIYLDLWPNEPFLLKADLLSNQSCLFLKTLLPKNPRNCQGHGSHARFYAHAFKPFNKFQEDKIPFSNTFM